MDLSRPADTLPARPGWRFLWGIYFYALCCSLFLTAGAFVLLWIEKIPLYVTVDCQSQPAHVLLCASVAVVITIGTALFLLKDRKRFFFANTLFLLVLITSVVICELSIRFLVPPWPARGLHGVESRYALKSWGRSTNDTFSIGVNEWGQRDRSRQRRPQPGVRRFICIGDSFLEEARVSPLPPVLDDLLGDANEVINLGVSATGPDEYYYRLKNIGIGLCPDHCVLFFYAGNDFLGKPSLKSYAGVVATYPRDSFLTSLKLQGINHALTNHKRPVLRLWSEAADLVRREARLFEQLTNMSDEQVREILLSKTPPQNRCHVKHQLDQKSFADFVQMLRHPDEGLFRSYYLESALQNVGSSPPRQLPIPCEYAYSWVKRTADKALKRGIGFTLVLIPEAFHVDPRMCSQYALLADMRRVTWESRQATLALLARARADGIDCVDLYPRLQGRSGTYLNMDGHWSHKGTLLAAQAVANHLRSRKLFSRLQKNQG